jgi:hypothetical protein
MAMLIVNQCPTVLFPNIQHELIEQFSLDVMLVMRKKFQYFVKNWGVSKASGPDDFQAIFDILEKKISKKCIGTLEPKV